MEALRDHAIEGRAHRGAGGGGNRRCSRRLRLPDSGFCVGDAAVGILDLLARRDAAVEQFLLADLIGFRVGERCLRALHFRRLPLDLGGERWNLEADEDVTFRDALALGVRDFGDAAGLRRDHDQLAVGSGIDDAGRMEHSANGASHGGLDLDWNGRLTLRFLSRRFAARARRDQCGGDDVRGELHGRGAPIARSRSVSAV